MCNITEKCSLEIPYDLSSFPSTKKGVKCFLNSNLSKKEMFDYKTVCFSVKSIAYDSIGWRPVVAVFCNILFSCNRHIVLSGSIFWFNKLGVNVGILPLYFFE